MLWLWLNEISEHALVAGIARAERLFCRCPAGLGRQESQGADGMVMVRSGDGRIAGLNAADGKRLWLYERSTPALVVRTHAGVAIQRGVAYAGFAAGKLAAISIKDGSVLWETMVSQPRGNTELERISDITSDPVVDDEQVCAISFQGRIACFDAAQGSPLWNRD